MAFFVEVQNCYERFDPSTPPGLRQSAAADIPYDDEEELTASGRFGPVNFRRYQRDLSYTTPEYLELLLTYSNHRALPVDARTGLLDCIADLIENRHGGRIVKRYLTELRFAHRTA